MDIQGINYELLSYLWDEDLEITQSSIIVVDGKPTMDTRKLRVMMVLKTLKSWTFRGTDENRALITEGEILTITEENVKKLPPSHGRALYKAVDALNTLTEDEEKN